MQSIYRLLKDLSFRFAIMSGRGARANRRNINAANEDMGIPAWLRQCMETIARNGQPVAADAAHILPASPAIDFPKICQDFRNLGGTPYLGTETLLETQTWVRVCERIFHDLGLEGNVRRLIASRHLKGEALCWWEIVIEETDEEAITWEDFRQRFEAKFISESERGVQLEKFINLKQGKLTAREYVSSFNLLGKYGMDLINTPAKKARKFANGLNQPLRDLAFSHLPMGATFDNLVEMALAHDCLHADSKQVVAKEEEKPGSSTKRKGNGKDGKKGKKSHIRCRKCGRQGHHKNDCRRDMSMVRCHNCKQNGHIRSTCPLPPGARPVVRAYALGAIPSASRPTVPSHGQGAVLEGLISISDVPFHALFDTGASHSFVSSNLVSSLHLKPDIVYDPLVVSNPVGGSANLSMICHGIRFSFNGFGFSIDAYVLGFSGYDLIIGMDWMIKHCAVLDCDKQLVRVRSSDGEELDLCCKSRSQSMLSYLYSLDISHEGLSTVPVVCEFGDVFEEVSGLPPHHEIEF